MLTQLINISLGAILAENPALTRFFGMRPFLDTSKDVNLAAKMGLAATVVITLSSALTWVVWTYVLLPLGLEFFRTVAFVLIIAALSQALTAGARRLPSAFQASFGVHLPTLTANSLVLGVVLLGTAQGLGLAETTVYGFASGLGFTLAAVLFAGVREKLKFAECPKCMEGFPLALVSAGLIALAFMGFAGFSI